MRLMAMRIVLFVTRPLSVDRWTSRLHPTGAPAIRMTYQVSALWAPALAAIAARSIPANRRVIIVAPLEGNEMVSPKAHGFHR
jgi:hypothetical protein